MADEKKKLISCFCNKKKLSLFFHLNMITKSKPLPIEFDYDELQVMTRRFKTPIGKGGFGSVYKGSFKHNGATLHVAVKNVVVAAHEDEDDGEVEESQFRREFTAIAGLHHANLSRLVGYCYSHERRHRFLVYEYMKNGSLDRWIFNVDDRAAASCLSWRQRHLIAIDVAKALKYLHRDCHDKVLHLDVKPENVLLDDELRGRVSDFGLSRLVEKGRETLIKTKGGGTLAYMAPEYILFDNRVSEKADVYSFGMMLFEIVHGERNYVPADSHDGGGRREEKKDSHSPFMCYPQLASQRVTREEDVMELVDKKLIKHHRQEVYESWVREMLCLALCCVQEKPDDRPNMEEVFNMLEGRAVPRMSLPETRMLVMELLHNGPESLEALFGTGQTEQRVFGPGCCDTVSTVSWLAMYRLGRGDAMAPEPIPPETEASTSAMRDIQRLARLPKEFTYEELRDATNGFSIRADGHREDHEFVGELDGGERVVVKRLGRAEFGKVIPVIAGVQHFNIVRFRGQCTKKHLLVYDFIPHNNGPLDEWIFSGDINDSGIIISKMKWLTWAQRYGVAMDVGSVLNYLIHNCNYKFLRPGRTFTADKIWLDKDFRARFVGYHLCNYSSKGEYWIVINGVYVDYALLIFELVTGRRRTCLLESVPELQPHNVRRAGLVRRIKGMVEERVLGDVDVVQLDALLDKVVTFYTIGVLARHTYMDSDWLSGTTDLDPF